MYTFVRVTGGVGRAFEDHCRQCNVEPRAMIEAMVSEFVARKNMDLPPAPSIEGNRFVAAHRTMQETQAQLAAMVEAEVQAIGKDMQKIEAHCKANGIEL